MKKYGVYIIAALVVLVLTVLIISNSKKQPRKLDERISLRQADKIPYGTSAAKNLLPILFPGAKVYFDKAYPAYWDSIYFEEPNQAVILVADRFNADADDVGDLFVGETLGDQLQDFRLARGQMFVGAVGGAIFSEELP